MSLTEAVASTAVGYCFALLITQYVFPSFGLYPSFDKQLMIVGIFTVVSIVRTYLMRRLFESRAWRYLFGKLKWLK